MARSARKGVTRKADPKQKRPTTETKPAAEVKAAKPKKKPKKVEVADLRPVPDNPLDAVIKISVDECKDFRIIDAEMRNHLQGLQLIKYRMEDRERKFVQQQQADKAQLDSQQALINTEKEKYTEFMTALAAKYGLEPGKLAVDPDDRVIRDLRYEAKY